MHRAARWPRIFGLFALFVALLGSSACASAAPGTIGAALGQRADRRLFIRSLPPGQGAERAGLLLDEEIVAIDGKDVRGMTQDEIRKAVRGDVGSTLVVTVLRGGARRDVKVTRTPLLAPGQAEREKKD